MPRIHDTAVIGGGVDVDADVTIGPFAVILGPARIGRGVWIGPGALIGGPPESTSSEQNAAWAGNLAHAGVEINDGAVIRDRAVIHQGTQRTTTVGARAWILNGAYVAHDVIVGDDAVVSAGVAIGGHVAIDVGANIGMNAVIHQRRLVGRRAMVGMGTVLTRDVPPFSKVFGSPPRIRGLNTVGLQRAGVDDSIIDELGAAYAEGDFEVEHFAGGRGEIADALRWWRAQPDRRPVRSGVHD